MRRNRCLEVVLGELRGAAIDFTISRGRHIKVRWSLNGVNCTTVVPVSSSDWRAPRSARSFVRRQIRQLGVAVVTP